MMDKVHKPSNSEFINCLHFITFETQLFMKDIMNRAFWNVKSSDALLTGF
jgi:hypothetical protein